MRTLVYAFGIVAIIDYAADGRMNMVAMMGSQTKEAFWNMTEGVIDGTGYLIRRVGYEVAQQAPRP